MLMVAIGYSRADDSQGATRSVTEFVRARYTTDRAIQSQTLNTRLEHATTQLLAPIRRQLVYIVGDFFRRRLQQ